MSQAVRKQRLVRSVVTMHGVPRITDVAVADAEWEANTDHSKAPASVKAKAAAASGQSMARQPVSGLAAASAREKNAKADLAELEFQEKAGKLVAAADVEKAWTEMVTRMRAAILSVPSKAKQALPHLSHTDLAQLNDLLSQALEVIADEKAGANGAAA